MRLTGRPACSIHRAALVDFVDRRDRESVPRAALAHLERCSECEFELTDLALTVAALRRLADDVAAVEPSTEAWPAVLARIDGRRSVEVHRPSLFGSLLIRVGFAGALVAAVLAIVLGGQLAPRGGPPIAAIPNEPRGQAALALEVTIDRGRRPVRPVEVIEATTITSAAITPAAWTGPDGLGIPRAMTKATLQRPNPTGGPI